MGYERNDRRYGGPSDDRGRDYRDDRSRSYGGGNEYRGSRYGSDRSGRDDDNDRGFFERAGDEVRSWFGDDDAERRRQRDERHDEHSDHRGGNRSEQWRYGDGGRFASGGGGGFAGGSSGSRSDFGGGRSTGNYGAGRGAGASSTYGLGGGAEHDGWGHDPNYRSWRDRQIQQLDQDYHEYRTEHQSKFDNEFHGWRQNRQSQRDQLGRVQEHQEVVGSDGQHIGTVDHVRGDRIQLTKSDQAAGGHHHSIPSSWIQSVDDKVTLSKTADQAKAAWRDEQQSEEARSRNGLFRDHDDDRRANLNRSFSGTYY